MPLIYPGYSGLLLCFRLWIVEISTHPVSEIPFYQKVWPDFYALLFSKMKYMTNRKIVAGVLTGLAAGAVISLIVSSKKNYSFSRKMIKKGNNLAEDLKGKFSEFVDRVEDKFQGILK